MVKEDFLRRRHFGRDVRQTKRQEEESQAEGVAYAKALRWVCVYRMKLKRNLGSSVGFLRN